MKATGRVIASGVIGIIGSLLTVLLAILLALTAFTFTPTPELPDGIARPPIPVTTVLVVQAIVLFALGVWGFISAIGLLKLKNWARISFLVFAGLLSAVSVMGMIGTLLAILVTPQTTPPGPEPLPPGFFVVFFGIFFVFLLGLVGLSLWWLIFFTRRRVKEQFLSEGEIAKSLRGPMSVTIIAWLLVLGGCFAGLSLLMP